MKYDQFLSESNSYDFGCAMIEVPFLDWSQITGMIEPDDVYEAEGDRSYGVQDNPHVTVLYGLHSSVSTEALKEAISGFSEELSIKVDGIGTFENEGFDVVKMNVVPDGGLLRLNEIISELPNSNEYPEYKPHITIAYVKKGLGRKYEDASFKREVGGIREICYSMPSGEKEYFEI
jgi:hypothetical protein